MLFKKIAVPVKMTLIIFLCLLFTSSYNVYSMKEDNQIPENEYKFARNFIKELEQNVNTNDFNAIIKILFSFFESISSSNKLDKQTGKELVAKIKQNLCDVDTNDLKYLNQLISNFPEKRLRAIGIIALEKSSNSFKKKLEEEKELFTLAGLVTEYERACGHIQMKFLCSAALVSFVISYILCFFQYYLFSLQ